MVIALLFAPTAPAHLKKLVSADDLVSFLIYIKSNFTTVTGLCGFSLNPVEVRGDAHFFKQGLIVSSLTP